MSEIANKYVCIHAFALRPLVISHPTGRTFVVKPGGVFVVSPEVVRQSAAAGLIRTVDPVADRDAPVSGDASLFRKHGAKFFDIGLHDAALAVQIELYKEPPPSVIVNAFARSASPPPAPAPATGFEYPERG